jgi:hypothetical protein
MQKTMLVGNKKNHMYCVPDKPDNEATQHDKIIY